MKESRDHGRDRYAKAAPETIRKVDGNKPSEQTQSTARRRGDGGAAEIAFFLGPTRFLSRHADSRSDPQDHTGSTDRRLLRSNLKREAQH